MIIYLEGVDGTGKSTLANYILETLDEVYYPSANIEPIESYNTRPDSKNRMSKSKLLSTFKKWAKDNTVHILDRGPLSDIVYRLFDEHEPVLNINEWLDFCTEYKDRITMIHCNTKSAEINMIKRGDDNEVSLKYHPIIYRAYNLVFDVIKKTGVNVVEYDYDKKYSINELLGEVSYFVYKTCRGGMQNEFDRKV